MSTATTMHPHVKRHGYLHLTSEYPLTVRVEILDVKTVWGNERYLVQPVAGAGETWVSSERVTDEFTPEPVAPPVPTPETAPAGSFIIGADGQTGNVIGWQGDDWVRVEYADGSSTYGRAAEATWRVDKDDCNALFCVLPRHTDEQHTDATGHSWLAPVPAREVLAHVIHLGGE